MSTWTRLASSIAALGLLVGLTACGESAVSDEDPRDNPGEPTTEAGASLSHMDPCNPSEIGDTNAPPKLYEPCVARKLSFNSDITLKAKLTDGNGSPLGNQRVYFGIVDQETITKVQEAGNGSFQAPTINDRADGMSLGSQAVATNSDGIATVELYSGNDPGVAPVVAWIQPEDTPDAQTSANYLRWRIPVSSKDRGAFSVEVVHQGQAEVKDLEVLLFDSNTSCDDLQTQFATRRDPNASFTPPTAQRSRDSELQGADGRQTVTFSELDKDQKFTVWARAYGAANPDIEKAWGCKQGDAIQGGGTVSVEVPLNDHVPILQDEYEVTHRFNLTDALPPDIQDYVELVGMFVKSPSSLLLGCEQGDQGVNGQELCPNGDIDGILVRLLETDFLSGLPVDADDVENVVNSIIGDSIRTALDQEIFDLISGTPIAGGVQVTSDIYDTITKFGVRGTISFPGNPSPQINENTGKVELVFQQGGAEQAWNEFAFFDSGGNNCDAASDFEQCRTEWIDVGQILTSASAIDGQFSARVEGLHSLHIDQHDLQIYFGQLVIGAIEHVVLPRYFSSVGGGGNVVANLDQGCTSCQSGGGDGVVSLEEVFANTLADCGQLANSVGSEGDTLHTTFENVCNDLRGRLIDRAKEEIINRLSPQGEGVLSIQTPSDAPCTMYEPANYDNAPDTYNPLPFIQTLGADESGSRCPWDLTLEFADSAGDVSGTFYGTGSN